MADMPMMDKAKSFWDKPEGKTGMLFIAGGLVLFVILMMRFGTAIVQAAQNTAILAVYIGVALALGYIIMDPKNRALAGYAYKGVMRWITGIIIEIDPIAILKSYVEDLKKSHAEMDKQIGKLRGTLAELKRKIKENTETMQSSMNIAKQAQKSMQNVKGEAQARMKAQVMLKTRKAGRLQDSNRTFQELHNKIEMIYRVLSKMHINCGVLIEDTEDSVAQKEIEWKTIKAAHGAMKSAMSIINGNQDKRAIYEQALDIMANDLDTKVGEMERFMEVSQSFLDGVDLQNGVFEEKGMELLEQWENDADSWLLGDEKNQLIKDSHDNSNELNLEATVTAPPGTINYKNLFN